MLVATKVCNQYWIDSGVHSKPYPQGFLKAFSYRAIGEEKRFTVLSDDESVIEELAQDYSKKHWGKSAVDPVELDQSKIGFRFFDHGKRWVVFAPYQYQKGHWIVINIDDHTHRCYYSTLELMTKQFCG